MAASPAKSPRLPSPPPIAEDQVGLSSPRGLTNVDECDDTTSTRTRNDASARRIRPGVKSEAMPEGPPLTDLHQIDSAFQLTEHLKALYAAHVTPEGEPDAIRPIDKATACALAQPPPGVDRGIWLYELCRFLTQKANIMAVGLFATEPPCSAQTCHEMRASEWQYLCAAHDPPKSCCAIDYCCHTLDWSATQLTSSKLFPSRLALGTDEGATATQQTRKMTEIFRRVYRIFAHAWFQHHEVFWQVENKTGLYVFFKTVCDEYRLIPEDNYTIPPEAEGLADGSAPADNVKRSSADDSADTTRGRQMPVGNVMIARGNTTKRHRGPRSEQSNSISTIIHEETEEEGSRPSVEHEASSTETPGDNHVAKPDDLASSPRGNHVLPIRLKDHHAVNSSEDVVTAIDRSEDGNDERLAGAEQHDGPRDEDLERDTTRPGDREEDGASKQDGLDA